MNHIIPCPNKSLKDKLISINVFVRVYSNPNENNVVKVKCVKRELCYELSGLSGLSVHGSMEETMGHLWEDGPLLLLLDWRDDHLKDGGQHGHNLLHEA